MKTFISLILSAIGLLNMASCDAQSINGTHGNKKIITKELEIQDFQKLSVVGNKMDVIYEQSEAKPYFRLECDENIWEDLEVKNDNGRLILQSKKEHEVLSPTRFVLHINSKQLNSINVVGRIHLQLDQINTDKLEVNMAGKSTIDSQGTTDEFHLDGAGSSTFNGKELKCRYVSIDMAGKCGATLYATEKIDCSIVGFCEIKYKGNPEVHMSKVGLSSVERIDE